MTHTVQDNNVTQHFRDTERLKKPIRAKTDCEAGSHSTLSLWLHTILTYLAVPRVPFTEIKEKQNSTYHRLAELTV